MLYRTFIFSSNFRIVEIPFHFRNFDSTFGTIRAFWHSYNIWSTTIPLHVHPPSVIFIDPPQIPPDRIVLNRQIGQGAFGLVFGGEAKTNGNWEAVAVKVTNVKATYEGKTDFLSEAKLMRSLKHGNVVRLIGVSLGSKDNLYLIMELMLLGDLKTYLLSRRIFAQR